MDSFLSGYTHVQEPMHDTDCGDILGYELLVREELNGEQFSGANDIVQRFTSSGQIQWLDAQGVRKAIDSIVESGSASNQIYSANVSRFSLEHREFEEYVESLIGGVDLGGRFYLDIMDMKFSYLRWQLQYSINRLKDKGAKFILGNLSQNTLSLLDVIDFGYVKIQQKQIDEDPVLCARLVQRVRDSGAVPIAVGVETQVQLNSVRNIGIGLLQGYHVEGPQALYQQALWDLQAS